MACRSVLLAVPRDSAICPRLHTVGWLFRDARGGGEGGRLNPKPLAADKKKTKTQLAELSSQPGDMVVLFKCLTIGSSV